MARSHFRYNATDDAGNALQNCKCFLYLPGTTTAVTDAWSAPTAGTSVTYLITNNQGEAECWFDSPQEVDVSITDNGHSAYYPGHQDVTSVLSIPSADVALLASANTFTGENVFTAAENLFQGAVIAGSVRLGDNDSGGTPDLVLTQGLGGTGNLEGYWQLGAVDATQGSIFVIAPGASVPANTLTGELLIYDTVGTDYRRFGIAGFNNSFIMDVSYNGTATANPFALQTGGSAGHGISGQTCLYMEPNARLSLVGSHGYTSGGGSWTGGTRIADFIGTGSAQLAFDTDTFGARGTDSTADDASIRLSRTGHGKWLVGLNSAGAGTDSFDFYSLVNSAIAMSLDGQGSLTITGDSISNKSPLVLVNSHSGGHTWRVGEQSAAGFLAFRDITASGAPTVAQWKSAPSDTETALTLIRNVAGTVTLQTVTMGAADSGGTGFKLLRVPN